jgi:polynucleotide 5'-kinase involved in rRNA processing
LSLLKLQRSALANYAAKVSELSKEFNKSRDNAAKERDASLSNALKSPIVYIINMNIEYMDIDLQLRFVRATFIEDLEEKEKEMASIEALIQAKRELALQSYLDDNFTFEAFQRVVD